MNEPKEVDKPINLHKPIETSDNEVVLYGEGNGCGGPDAWIP